MAIETGTNFHVKTNLPLDSRSVAKTAAERDAIPEGERYEGMRVYVEDEHKFYTAKYYTTDNGNSWIWTDSPQMTYAGRVNPNALMLMMSVEKNGKAGMTVVANRDEMLQNPITSADIMPIKCNDILILKKDVIGDGVNTVFVNKDTFLEYFDIIPCLYDELLDKIASTVGSYTWYLDTDEVKDLDDKSYGTMASCQTDAFVGKWFYLCTTNSRSGSGPYPSKYTVAGANGKVSYGDYVMWTGSRLVHISINEAKSSDVKNGDGHYSSTGGVDGLMSSTDKAYLTDLINSFWGKTHIPVRHCKDSTDANMKNGWLVNWCREDGWYIGGLGADCVNHPPYTGGNKVNWLLLVVNGMKGAENEDWYNLRVQIAFDIKNSLIYMRRGWISGNTWTTDGTDGWTKVGAVPNATQSGAGLMSAEDKKKLDGLGAPSICLGTSKITVDKTSDTTVTFHCPGYCFIDGGESTNYSVTGTVNKLSDSGADLTLDTDLETVTLTLHDTFSYPLFLIYFGFVPDYLPNGRVALGFYADVRPYPEGLTGAVPLGRVQASGLKTFEKAPEPFDQRVSVGSGWEQ